MDYKDWEILTVLHETKNVTKAAKRLFITQPALSQRLKNIEQFFDASLILRGNKGIQFTEEGEVLFEVAREHLKTMARLRDQLTNMRSSVSGMIRIGSTNYTTKYFLPLILRRFKEAHPLVEFRVITGVSKDIITLVENNDVHLGFIRGSLPWSGDRHLLFKEGMLLVNREPFRIVDLPSMPMIHYTIAPPNQEHIDRWWSERFSTPPSVAMMVDRADTCLELIAQGLGFGFLPTSIFGGQEKLPHMEMRYLSNAPVERAVWTIFHQETTSLRLVSSFLDLTHSLNFASLFFT